MRPHRVYLALVTMAAVAMGVLFYLAIGDHGNLARQVEVNRQAIAANARAFCLLKADYQARIERDDAYLHKHPKGSLADLLREARASSRETLRSLTDVRCPTGRQS